MCKPGCSACSAGAKGAYLSAAFAGLLIALAAEKALTAVGVLSPVIEQITCGVFVFCAVGVLAVARVLAGAPALAGARTLGARVTWHAYQVSQARVLAAARRPVATRQRIAVAGSRQGAGGLVSPAMLPAGLPAAQTPTSDVMTTVPDNMPDNNPARQPVIPAWLAEYLTGRRVTVVIDETPLLGGDDVEEIVAKLAALGRRQ